MTKTNEELEILERDTRAMEKTQQACMSCTKPGGCSYKKFQLGAFNLLMSSGLFRKI